MGFCLPLVGSGAVTSIRSIAMSDGGRGNVGLHNWAWGRDSDLKSSDQWPLFSTSSNSIFVLFFSLSLFCYLVLNRLALLVGDSLGDHLAVNLLNVLASGDRHLLGSLLGGVGTDFLGHLTAVRLDGHLAGSLGDGLDLDLWHCHWSRVDSGNWGRVGNGPSSIKTSANSAPIDSCTTGNSSTISSISTIAISPIACL